MNRAEIAVIGAGPAGMAAALQLKRSGLSPVVFERNIPGGLLRNANLVENYPGFPNGIKGNDLADLFQEQCHQLSLEIRQEEVCDISFETELVKVTTNLKSCTFSSVVIASGTRPKYLPDTQTVGIDPGRICYEVYPIRSVKDKNIVVLGAGDAAFDYALNLAQNNHITIINRSSRIKCLPLLQKRAGENQNIEYVPDTELVHINEHGCELILQLKSSQGERELSCSHLLVAIGRTPSLDFLDPAIRVQHDVPGRRNRLFLIGDVRNRFYRQTAIAVGDGIRAAMKLYFEMRKNQ